MRGTNFPTQGTPGSLCEADVLNSGLVLVARTDAEAATMIDSNIDARCANKLLPGVEAVDDEKCLLPTNEVGKKRGAICNLLYIYTIFKDFFPGYVKIPKPRV